MSTRRPIGEAELETHQHAGGRRGEELGRLTEALTKHDDRQAADIIRLLLLTGARSGEVRAARWDQFDLEPVDSLEDIDSLDPDDKRQVPEDPEERAKEVAERALPAAAALKRSG